MSFWEAVTDRVKTVYSVVVHDPKIQGGALPPKMPEEMDYVDLYNFADTNGFTYAWGVEYPAVEARETIQRILDADHLPAEKYDALHVLDIRVQNQTLAECFQVENEILAAQYQLIKQMEVENGR